MKYRAVFFTNIPAFYKLNLYNLVDKTLQERRNERIFVLFNGKTEVGRNTDFFKGSAHFNHAFLQGGTWQRCWHLHRLLRGTAYDRLVIGGWNTPENWTAALCSPRRKNCVVVESSIHESRLNGLKGFMKRLFLRRIGRRAYVPGESNERLLRELGFRGEIVQTRGVGVFRYVPQPPYVPRSEVRRFLFVGRLVWQKNLKLLIEVFNSLPQLTLTIAGFGEQEKELKAMAKGNVRFLGAVDNAALPTIYQAHDAFVLPSVSETWGLVVEEALNNGLPVIVSDRVGCHEAIVNDTNGIVFSPADSAEALRGAVLQMTDVDFHNSLRRNITRLDFADIERRQVECYL